MNIPHVLTAVGLSLDLSGALLLWKYGLPESVSRDGSQALILESRDESQVNKARQYDRWATVGLLMLCSGFGLQLIATLL